MAGTATWRVSYHGGNLFSLVEADMPERAVEIAKAWRERKRLWSGKPPPEVLGDEYTIRPATDRDIEWAAKFGCKPYTTMPPPRRGKPPLGAVEGVGVHRGREAA